MPRVLFHINRCGRSSGFSLVEIMLAIGLLVMIVPLATMGIRYGLENAALSGSANRASFLAEEGLEAARNIRNAGFSSLVNGTYGLVLSGGRWTLSGSSDTTDIFTRAITITTVDAVTRQVVSTVTWPQNGQRTGTVQLTTYLGNIGLLSLQANSLSVSKTAAVISGSELQGVTIQNVGSPAIVVDKVTVTWTNALRTIRAVRINSVDVWTGTQTSGAVLDLANVTLAAGAAATPINRFLFNSTMTGNIFTITFTMADGSTKLITVP